MHAAIEAGALASEASRPRLYVWVKRLLDLLISFAVLLSISPVLLICMLALRLDSQGPILFRQERIGERGKPFTILKLRSMYHKSDSEVHRQYVTAYIQGQAAAQAADGTEMYKLVHDPRITPVGHWLRRTSLDELPQLWNVLRGEMSLVGPRPPLLYEVENYNSGHLLRLAVQPGITGLWQVSGRNSTTFEEMVALDLEDIRRASLVLDLSILVKTIPVVIRRRAA